MEVVQNINAKYPSRNGKKLIIRSDGNELLGPEQRRELYQGGSILSDYNPITRAKSTLNGARMALFGQDDYTAPVKKVLEMYGNQKIQSMVLVRSPVEKVLVSAMDAVSFGNFKKKMEQNDFDTLYHLQVDITLANRVVVRTEKVEVVNLEVGTTQKSGQEEKEVVDNMQRITLKQLLENCRKRMGKNFFTYSAKSNNCQDYLLNLFQASNIGTQEDYDFIKQDTKALFKNQDGLRKVSNSLTGIGAKFNILTKGGSVVLGKANTFAIPYGTKVSTASMRKIAF